MWVVVRVVHRQQAVGVVGSWVGGNSTARQGGRGGRGVAARGQAVRPVKTAHFVPLVVTPHHGDVRLVIHTVRGIVRMVRR